MNQRNNLVMSSFRDATKRLQHIVDECAPKKTTQDVQQMIQMDEFSRLKQQVAQQLKDVRGMLKNREELFVARGTSAETAEASWRIRLALKECKEWGLQMEKLQQKEQKKAEKKMKPGWIQETLKTVRQGPDEDTVLQGDEEAPVETSQEAKAAMDKALMRKDVVELVWSHIEEVECLEKQRFTDKVAAVTSPERTMLLASSSKTPTSASPTTAVQQDYFSTQLADIEDSEDWKLINANNALIDQELDGIKAGVGALKEIAKDMEGELDKQQDMLNDITEKVDKEIDHIDHINVRMKDSVEKFMRGDKFVLNCVLLLVLLALIAFIVTFFT